MPKILRLAICVIMAICTTLARASSENSTTACSIVARSSSCPFLATYNNTTFLKSSGKIQLIKNTCGTALSAQNGLNPRAVKVLESATAVGGGHCTLSLVLSYKHKATGRKVKAKTQHNARNNASHSIVGYTLMHLADGSRYSTNNGLSGSTRIEPAASILRTTITRLDRGPQIRANQGKAASGAHFTNANLDTILQQESNIDQLIESSIKLPSGKPEDLGKVIDMSKTTLSAVKQNKLSLSPVLQAGKIKIIIDAGHGGRDSGTVGFFGTYEKDVVIEYAKALYIELKKLGFNAKLTRSGDYFLTLHDRRELARSLEGHLFISLHADSAPRKSAKGLSVYTLSDQASDAVAKQLSKAQDESFLSGIKINSSDNAERAFLVNMVQQVNVAKSEAFSKALLHNCKDREIKLLSAKTKSAGFAVLKGPDIPAVLIELGFLSNPEEEILLNTSIYKKEITNCITQTINNFFAVQQNTI